RQGISPQTARSPPSARRPVRAGGVGRSPWQRKRAIRRWGEVSDAMALVTVVGGGRSAAAGALRGLADAFRAARLPVVHAIDAGLATSVALDAPTPLDLELLADGGVQTLGPAELAIALAGKGAFDATPLDAVLRGLGV